MGVTIILTIDTQTFGRSVAPQVQSSEAYCRPISADGLDTTRQAHGISVHSIVGPKVHHSVFELRSASAVSVEAGFFTLAAQRRSGAEIICRRGARTIGDAFEGDEVGGKWKKEEEEGILKILLLFTI